MAARHANASPGAPAARHGATRDGTGRTAPARARSPATVVGVRSPVVGAAPAVSSRPRNSSANGTACVLTVPLAGQRRAVAPAMRRWLALLLIVMGLATLPGCTVAPWRDQPPPWSEASVAGADDVRLLLRDGSELVLAAPRIERAADGPVLVGAVDGVEQGIPLADVSRLETRHTELLPLIANVAIATVVVVGVVALCCAGGGGSGGCSLSGLNFGSCDDAPACAPHA